MQRKAIITSPSLELNYNVSGISAVTSFIIANNLSYEYIHFELGKKDDQKRGAIWFFDIIKSFLSWCRIMFLNKNIVVHVNFALETRAIVRDTPFILVSRMFHRKTIIHLHGGKYLLQDAPKWLNWLITLVLNSDEPKIVLSSYEKEIIMKRFKNSNIFVLPNCIDLDDAKSFKHIYSDFNPLKLLFMGRIVKSKGIEYIYNACNLLKENKIKFKLYVAGKGADQIEYNSKFSSLLKDDYIFKGVVSGSDKNSLIKSCDVFLLPSIFGEGLPMALLESMSFGLVPITTNDGSIGILVKNGENGFIVNKYSSDEIARAICMLDNDRNLVKNMGENSKMHILNNYDKSKFISQLNAIYNS
jgi:glycosyltransferase involved in cell wall biosynthesis